MSGLKKKFLAKNNKKFGYFFKEMKQTEQKSENQMNRCIDFDFEWYKVGAEIKLRLTTPLRV